MRAGKTVATADPRTISVPELTRMIVGSNVTEVPAPSKEIGAPILTVAELKGARADGHVALTGASPRAMKLPPAVGIVREDARPSPA